MRRPQTPESRRQVHPAPRTPPERTPKSDLPVTPPPRSSGTRMPHKSSPRSPRNPANTYFMKEQDRRTFLGHLKAWALDHDSSVHFQGSIALLPSSTGGPYKLGASARCILIDNSVSGGRKEITIRLFPPRLGNSRYRLVVRSGSSWLTAKDFLNKEYAKQLHLRHGPFLNTWYDLGLPTPVLHFPDIHDEICIQPLFHPFQALPGEIQHLILAFAMGKKKYFRPAHDGGFVAQTRSSSKAPIPPTRLSPTRLYSLLSISKSLNATLSSWVYKTTTFYFETSGFTNFLWLSGPINRANIRKIGLAFGKFALLHCVRWLAPDEVFELFGTELNAFSYGLQYLWRCQIRDLVAGLHLSNLSIDISSTPIRDIPFVVRILTTCFGSIDFVHFVDAMGPVGNDDMRLAGLKKNQSWATLCGDAFKRYRDVQHHEGCFGVTRREKDIEDLERDMADNIDFFAKHPSDGDGEEHIRRDSGIEL